VGAAEGFNVLTTNTAGFEEIGLVARAVPSSAFPFDIRYLPGAEPPPVIKGLLDDAVARLRKVFVRAPGLVQGPVPANACAQGQPAMNEVIPGVVVWVDVRSIDGRGGVLGSAFACYSRVPSLITSVGYLRLDLDDIAAGLSDGTALATTLHELLHAMGYGNKMWTDLRLLSGSLFDPFFSGPQATAAFRDALTGPYAGLGVPLENVGGSGTALSHWRTSLMSPELMTGFSCTGFAPLSYITLAAFLDMGLHVTKFGDDDFDVPLTGCPASQRRSGVYETAPVQETRYVDEMTGAAVSEHEAMSRSRAVLGRSSATRASRPSIPLFAQKRR
jgi:hypothetical protein